MRPGQLRTQISLSNRLAKNYADFVTRTENGGAQAGTPPTTAPQKPMTLASAVAEKIRGSKIIYIKKGDLKNGYYIK